jgi:hypothetical protein
MRCIELVQSSQQIQPAARSVHLALPALDQSCIITHIHLSSALACRTRPFPLFLGDRGCVNYGAPTAPLHSHRTAFWYWPLLIFIPIYTTLLSLSIWSPSTGLKDIKRTYVQYFLFIECRRRRGRHSKLRPFRTSDWGVCHLILFFYPWV